MDTKQFVKGVQSLLYRLMERKKKKSSTKDNLIVVKHIV